jgi:putative ABC transport system permease protein
MYVSFVVLLTYATHDAGPRQVVRRAERDAVVELASVRELLGDSLARERFTTFLLTVFAALALVLAAVGLYGVLSHFVVSRTREIGVRVALGATASRIRTLVLRAGLSAVLVGLLFGSCLAAAGLHVLRSAIFGLSEQRPSGYAATTIVLLVVGSIAMLLPAHRAARLDPVRAIRAE